MPLKSSFGVERIRFFAAGFFAAAALPEAVAFPTRACVREDGGSLRGERRRPRSLNVPMTDHPRVGGEHRSRAALLLLLFGSPPRRRGARCARLRAGWCARITPASAGSTMPEGRRHLGTGPGGSPPRRRGARTPLSTPLRNGSPPRRRGARDFAPDPRKEARITPASAGSTSGPAPCPLGGSDHPRVGGEHARERSSAGSRSGPPPRRRGALVVLVPVRARHRTTPASAGSTDRYVIEASRTSDHPRVGGEHRMTDPKRLAVYGPPPRRRGARPGPESDAGSGRTTPASAGSTRAEARPSPAPEDHPRVGGEHY